MKKQFIFLIIGMVFLTGFIIADGTDIINIDKVLRLSSAQQSKLTSLNLNTYYVKDFNIGTEQVKRVLYKQGAINKENIFDTYWMNCSRYSPIKTIRNLTIGNDTITESYYECLEKNKVYHTKEEIINIMNDWEKSVIESVADVGIKRDNQIILNKTREGTTTIIR